jgi:hypothetical protein
MPEPELAAFEAVLRVQVDRAVARYEGKVPPFMIAKLREIAERYWREHPQASRILQVLAHGDRARSGIDATAQARATTPDGQDRADGTTTKE